MSEFDVVVLGAGPAGYVGAIRAAQLGARVALVDPGPPGGTCCNRGCIPTKALLQSAKVLETVHRAAEFGVLVAGGARLDLKAAVERKDRVVRRLTDGIRTLLGAYGVTLFAGTGVLEGPGRVRVGEQVLLGRNVLVATGSEPARLGLTDGLPPGVVLDSTSALELTEPPARIAIIGGGVVGVEFAAIFRSWGSEVVLLEALPQILPGVDRELARVVIRHLEASGVRTLAGVKVTTLAAAAGGGATVTYEKAGAAEALEVDRVLVAVGRRPNTAGLGLEPLGVKIERGFIQVDAQGFTGVPGLWAAGDVTGAPLLAHRASAQAANAVEAMLGHAPSQNLALVPSCVYTEPEIAMVGLTEEEAKRQGRAYQVGRFSFAVNGKAMAEGADDGLVKVLVSEDDGEILGVHIVGPNASALISELTVAMSMEATLYDVAAAIHPHPTLSEAVPEALLDAVGMAIHKRRRTS